MPTFVPFEGRVRALAFKVAFEGEGLCRRTDRVATPRRDEHPRLGESRLIRRRPRNEWMHKDEFVEQAGGHEGDCGENIGAVGIAEADGSDRREA